jgi:hypothetical protein
MYSYLKFIWVCWIVDIRKDVGHRYFDNNPRLTLYPESMIRYLTFGLSQDAVFKKLKKKLYKLLDVKKEEEVR